MTDSRKVKILLSRMFGFESSVWRRCLFYRLLRGPDFGPRIMLFDETSVSITSLMGDIFFDIVTSDGMVVMTCWLTGCWYMRYLY